MTFERSGSSHINFQKSSVYERFLLSKIALLIFSNFTFLASQDALEVMLLTYLLTYSLHVSIDLTDVTLVGDDT